MARRRSIPAYCLHKQSGQAVVTLRDDFGGRRDVLLGEYDTPASRREYTRVIAEWEASGHRLPPAAGAAGSAGAAPSTSVNELLLAYWPFAQRYYCHADGEPTNEVNNLRLILRRLRELYGETPAADFDSGALKALRGRMVGEGLARTRINKDMDRVKRLFKWAAAEKLVPLTVWQSLGTVGGLRAGRSEAKETEPVRPVAVELVEATLPHVSAQVAAMARLQLLTGMRPGEVTVMRGLDLDMRGPVWFYRPGSDRGRAGKHKTAHRGHERLIAIGPRAQEVLRPWLRLALDEYLFQPCEARAAFNADRRAKRKSKVTPSQAARKPKARPKKTPGQRYTDTGYCHAITAGCIKAHAASCDQCRQQPGEKRPAWMKRIEDAPCLAAALWAPNQMRHTKATEIRREAGIDAARAVLGHRSPAITETYAELDRDQAAKIMERLG